MNQYESTYQRLVKKGAKAVGVNPRLEPLRRPEMRYNKDGKKIGTHPVNTDFGRICKFWRNVEIKGDDECWNWKKCLSLGYGVFSYRKKSCVSSRLAMIFIGIDLKDKMVCHSCDNRSCCNPNHLFLGTNKDNMRDCWNKKRNAWQIYFHPIKRGEDCIHTKLKNEDIPIIRKLGSMGMTHRDIGKIFNICKTSVSLIIIRRTWNHIKK